MNYLQSVILGIIEGATEYLPVSSTFHLIWASNLLNIPQTDFQKAYEVIIQAGAILAVLIIFWKTIINNKELIIKVIISFIPTAIVGLILYKVIKNVFFGSFTLQISVFIIVGLLFIFFEKQSKKLNKKLENLTYKEAVIIGLIQAMAVIPGVSRAGAVILGMMFLGIKRDESAKYSFILAIPTLLAASALDLYKSLPILSSHRDELGILIIGFVFAFISAFLVVRWFISYLSKKTLAVFGWYRIIVGIILISYLVIILRY